MTTTSPTDQASSQTSHPTRWILDASHSSVSFSVRHLMISNVRGEFHKVSGSATYDPASPASAKINVSIDVASLQTRDEARDGHLKGADFFDAAKFPTITFSSKSVRKRGDGLEIVGDLTIREVTREVTLAVDEITGEQADLWGKTRVGATAKTKILRSDFGITWNAALETGGVVVGDEVKINLEVELIKQV